MLTVGDKLPPFRLQAVVGLDQGQEFQEITHETHKGRWQVLFFWPMDFTFICPTEIAEFGKRNRDFQDRRPGAGRSTDTHFVHLAWRKSHDDLKALPSPCSRTRSGSSRRRSESSTRRRAWRFRATFIVDPEGVIRWASVNDLSVGRNVPEVLPRARRLADRRALPLQLGEGSADPSSGLT
jgi:peroxiredoxin (alkyl hydroperoxide reductase subunit C)